MSLKNKEIDFNLHIKSIETLGYTIVKNFKDKNIINNLLSEIEKLSLIKMRGSISNSSIDSKLSLSPHINSENFCRIIFDKDIEKICKYFLNDPFYRSIPKELPNYSLNFSQVRSSGRDELEYHRDDRNPPSNSNEVCYLQFALALEKSDASTGCTTCVPKSHIINSYVKDIDNCQKKDLILSPGDLLIYDGRLWHSAKPNITNNTRWVFFFAYSRWHLKQTYDFTKNIGTTILKTLNINEKLILGFHCITKIFDSADSGSAGQRGDIDYANINYQKELKSRNK